MAGSLLIERPRPMGLARKHPPALVRDLIEANSL
jgi:hypothetical protein